MSGPKPTVDVGQEYQYGFHSREDYVFKSERGLTRKVVEGISEMKGEPAWMREFRLRALDLFLKRPMPTWGNTELMNSIDFENIYYYIKPTEKQGKTWEEVPADIKNTFDRLGIPEAERKFLAGVSAQYESEVVYHSLREDLEKQGVIFLDMDSGLREHPEIVKEYFATVIPPNDNKFASLNSAVWSGGSFIYVPPGVQVQIPLQAYFRINAENMGQFERTLIIADEGSRVHYIEGCFTKGTPITTNPDHKPIEAVKVGDRVLTHTGEYRRVYHVQQRPYSGILYTIEVYGDTQARLKVTREHPLLSVPRRLPNERNKRWNVRWATPLELRRGDYLAVPINRVRKSLKSYPVTVLIGRGRHPAKAETVEIPSTPEFFRLAGYFLAEGSVDPRGYVHLSFHIEEKEWLEDSKNLFRRVFGVTKFHVFEHKRNHGVSLIVSSVRLARAFEQLFGRSAAERRIPQWMIIEDLEKQKELVIGVFRGDGNYYKKQNKHGRKELFRLNTISETLARQLREILLRLGIFACFNRQDRKREGRRMMHALAIGGDSAWDFGKLVGIPVESKLNGKKRAGMFHIDGKYAYVPVKAIRSRGVSELPVYNFSVEGDESYTAHSVAVHNCTAPTYSSDSLHSAVVELIAKKGAHLRYTTIQNWSKNVYNLVTKRAVAHEDATVEWVDGNLGCLTGDSKVFLNPRGAVDIKDIQPGDTVYGLDLNDLAIRKFPVRAARLTGTKSVFRLVTEDDHEIRATANHPFLALEKEAYSSKTKFFWKSLESLGPGSLIAVSQDAIQEKKSFSDSVEFVHVRSVEPAGVEEVYDLEIEGAHNFLANGFIVHNSKLTMKYPSVYLVGKGARGEVLSVAFSGRGQHQDAGAKMIHVAPNTTSTIISKSVSKDGGRTSYRGMLKVYPGATGVKANVRCDALLMDEDSRSDTYPTMEIDEKQVNVGHEATVSKVGEEQLFYMMSRGMTEQEATSMIINGFFEPFAKELPLEYAVELNRLIQLEMSGSVG